MKREPDDLIDKRSTQSNIFSQLHLSYTYCSLQNTATDKKYWNNEKEDRVTQFL